MTIAFVGLLLFGCGGDDDSTGAGGAGGAGAGTSAGGGGGAAGGSGGGTSSPDPQYLPTPTGTCPQLVAGAVTFEPAGIAPRAVQLWMADEVAASDGPLVFYWHGAGSSPVSEPPYGLGEALDAVRAQGGVVAAPHHDPAAGQWPWFLTAGSGPEDDLLVADEVLACAIEQVGIDTRRIHSIGMSAGALQTTQLSYRRSGYFASVVTYSGGLIGSPPQQEDQNKFAAMIFHGGPTDQVMLSFQQLSEAYRDDLLGKGHFAFICDHGQGHELPKGGAQASLWQFFEDHRFGTVPSPYQGGLPGGFPAYCAL